MSQTEEKPADALADEFRRCVVAGEIDAALAVQRQLWRSDPPFAARTVHDIPMIPWERGFAEAEHDRFLFVSGAPRSGTTALGRLLNIHRRIAIYIELFSSRLGYTPEMFNRANIARLNREGVLESLDKPRNLEILERAKPRRIVGDKRPNFMTSAAMSLPNFAGKSVTVVHVVRGIHEVAMSYVARAEAEIWDAARDHKLAVEQLNMNNRLALDLVDRIGPGHRLFILDYRSFWSSAGNVDRLFREIEVNPKQASDQEITKMFRIAHGVLKREPELSADARSYIDAHYDFDAEARLRALAFA